MRPDDELLRSLGIAPIGGEITIPIRRSWLNDAHARIIVGVDKAAVGAEFTAVSVANASGPLFTVRVNPKPSTS
jgi:hypothetical protein